MKNITSVMLLVLIVMLSFVALPAYSGGQGRGGGGSGSGGGGGKGSGGGSGRSTEVSGTGSSTVAGEAVLSEGEIAGLILMREEEKLARDVYDVLGKKWSSQVFLNIKRAEQQHMDAVGRLLDKYNIEDPAVKAAGRFTSSELQKLYDQLVEKGNRSYADALAVGAEIEDVDIADLRRLLAATSNSAIKATYESLLRGSENHLRAFMRSLAAAGGSYSAKYLTQEQFDAIVGSSQERGSGKGSGGGSGSGKGSGSGGGSGSKGGGSGGQHRYGRNR